MITYVQQDNGSRTFEAVLIHTNEASASPQINQSLASVCRVTQRRCCLVLLGCFHCVTVSVSQCFFTTVCLLSKISSSNVAESTFVVDLVPLKIFWKSISNTIKVFFKKRVSGLHLTSFLLNHLSSPATSTGSTSLGYIKRWIDCEPYLVRADQRVYNAFKWTAEWPQCIIGGGFDFTATYFVSLKQTRSLFPSNW